VPLDWHGVVDKTAGVLNGVIGKSEVDVEFVSGLTGDVFWPDNVDDDGLLVDDVALELVVDVLADVVVVEVLAVVVLLVVVGVTVVVVVDDDDDEEDDELDVLLVVLLMYVSLFRTTSHSVIGPEVLLMVRYWPATGRPQLNVTLTPGETELSPTEIHVD
jgi:hypothetical protein